LVIIRKTLTGKQYAIIPNECAFHPTSSSCYWDTLATIDQQQFTTELQRTKENRGNCSNLQMGLSDSTGMKSNST
jgi:hypothetical protein